ncbi:MAG: response regulator [Myxococcaceae bacterium]|nr:response regulator [Myxococcaceae bacterium]
MSGYVLYVDDDPANLIVFEAGLKRDLPVLTANGGAQGLELLRTHDVAVVLSDQRMPAMSGVELLAKVREEWPDVIRMLVTAYSDVEAAIAAINVGHAHLYLKKPWEPVELKLALQQARERFLAARHVADLQHRLMQTERLYALGVVAAGVAHELRSPLSALHLGVEVLSGVLEGPLDDEQVQLMRETVQDADLSVKAMVDITNAMELSTRQQPVSTIDLREVVELAARSVRGEARLRGEVTLSLDHALVRGSRTNLGQVVLNLLVNALQAFDPTRRARNAVKVTLVARDGRATLTVSDNGPGIGPDVVGRIFDPFFTTKTEGGTGLGLAISRQIVTELGGTIAVHSTVGEGTQFVVEVPLVTGEATASSR